MPARFHRRESWQGVKGRSVNVIFAGESGDLIKPGLNRMSQPGSRRALGPCSIADWKSSHSQFRIHRREFMRADVQFIRASLPASPSQHPVPCSVRSPPGCPRWPYSGSMRYRGPFRHNHSFQLVWVNHATTQRTMPRQSKLSPGQRVLWELRARRAVMYESPAVGMSSQYLASPGYRILA